MPFAKSALAAALQILGAQAAIVWPGHVEYPLGLLDGTDGFRVTAESSTGRLGYSVAGVGDVNNDGFDDVILGESPELATTAGAAYVVFGSESFSAVEMDVSALDGTNGFKIEGADAGDFAGTAVAGAGDINGDGFDDIMVGAWGGSSAAGEILIVFGAATFPAVVGITDLDGSTGFVMLGATTSDAAGFSLAAAGDVNNDGAADIIIGAYQADPVGSMSGEVYVVFGSLSWTESLLNLGELGANGLTFQGAERREYVGYSVAGAGDVNDDGYSDVIISAHGANKAYVFYGAATFSSDVYSLSTLSGTDGFIVSTGNDGDEIVVAGVGDMNNDGYGDIAIGHALADPLSGGDSSGATYVVLGGGAIPSPLDVLTDLDGSNGFMLEGASEGDRSGTSVSDAGDINQDGYGDIVVGAPGVGSDAGSAYVVFGGAAFSEASYNIGTIGAEGSYKLVAPSDEGYGGYSVAGAGDMNQDGFPDLVVGAYGSGLAGEAFVVFPGLTGTPPPTMTPTPAPTGPTPAPFDGGAGATPAPTVNFLVPGVVGGGTVYESPEVFLQAQELGGEVLVGADRWFDEDTRVTISLEGLNEKSAEGSHVGLGAAIPHTVAGESLVYEAAATTNVTVQGIAAQESTMVTSVLGGETTITIIMQVFEEDGVITSGDEQTDVSAGTLKFSLAISDWPFCDPATVPTRSTQDRPSTVCAGASSTFETGSFLDAKLVVTGPSSSTPVISSPQSGGGGGGGGGGEGGGVDGAGLEYGMSGGSAEASLVMSEWVKTDSNGWTKAEELSLSGTTFTVRFPASSGTLLYDPTLQLTLIPDDEDEFWRHPWFVWTTASFGALVFICLLGCGISRTRRAKKDKVSPGFEGVAPAMDPGGGDATQKGGLKGALVKVFSSWRKRGHTPVPQNDTAARGKSYVSKLRWRRKGPSVANLARTGTGKRGGGRQAAAPSSGAGAAGGSPDWIQGLGGAGAGDAGAAPSNAGSNTAGVPDWLAEVVPAAPTAGGGGADANNPGAAYDDTYYGQGYEGYEDYEGYYEGYDEGYYYQEAGYGAGGGAQGGQSAGAGAGAGTPAATPPPAGAGDAGAGGGGGLSWLTNAASTVNDINDREEEAR